MSSFFITASVLSDIFLASAFLSAVTTTVVHEQVPSRTAAIVVQN